MKVVKVYGALRKKLGQCRFEFVAETPAQALRALITNFPGLDRWLIDSEKDGVAYRVTVGKEKIGQEDATGLFLPWSERQVFSITPVLTGAGGGGVGQILVGVGLVAAAIVLGPAAGGFLGLGAGLAGGAGLVTGAVATGIGLVGTGLILSGVATLLSPAPSLTGAGSIGIRDEAAARLESFSFSGLVNTTKQGLPVPIAYGRVFTGSAVVSAGLDTDDI
jgi:predicted phage tail protein